MKFSCCNVGASSPTDYGDFYAWGETTTKSSFGSGNYDYYGSYVIPNNIALTGYDVATVKWGSPWCMPTFTQIRELANNCTFQWTTISGVKGAKFTGPNGNSIFIPAGGAKGSGFANGASSVTNQGVMGYYWASTITYRQNGNSANSLIFNSGGVKLSYEFFGQYYNQDAQCYNGLLVRPVTK